MKRKAIFALLVLNIANVFCKLLPFDNNSPDSTLVEYEESALHSKPFALHSNMDVEYDVHEKQIIPAWATGDEEVHNGHRLVCINGVCSKQLMTPPHNGPTGYPGEEGRPAGDPRPSMIREAEKYARPYGTGVPIPIPFDPQHPNRGSLSLGKFPFFGGHLGHGPVSRDGTSLLGGLNGPVTGFGNGPTTDETLGVLFSIGDEDSYLLLSHLNMDLPMKSLVSSVTVTESEAYAQDSQNYLMAELEGKASIFGVENGLNVLYTTDMFFYIPKTAISITVQRGRVIYSYDFVHFLRRLKLNTGMFTKLIDRDGTTAYYIPIYGSTIALANPMTPIVSQYLITPEGYGLYLLKAKRIEIDKGILVLNRQAYDDSDVSRVTGAVQKFVSGELREPFSYINNIYAFGEESSESEYSASDLSTDKSSSKKKESKKESDSSTKSQEAESEEVYMDSDSSSYSSTAERVKDTADSLMRKADRLRERLANLGLDKKRQRRRLEKAAKKAQKKAEKMRYDEENEELLKARRRRVTDQDASSESEKKSQEKKGYSAAAGESWYSDNLKKNNAVKGIIAIKDQSSSAAASAFEESSRKMVSKSFTSNGASAIISAHQSNEMYYKGVASSEYATREIKHTLMGMTMQHALFSTKGRMYRSQKYTSYGVRSSRSSRSWLRRRMTKIIRRRRAESRASRNFMKNGATAAGVALAAAKEQAARQAAIRATRRAMAAQRKAASYAAMAKKAKSAKNAKMAKAYQRKASQNKRAYGKYAGKAATYGAAIGQFRAAKLAECSKQATLFAQQIKNPQSAVTKQDLVELQKAVAQILTSSQIQVLSKALSARQIRVLTSLLTPQQVQQTLVHMGAMSVEQMQLLLLRLQIKGAELEKMPAMNLNLGLNAGGLQAMLPLGTPAVNSFMLRIQGQPGQMSAPELMRYLTQGQAVFQTQENLLSAEQMEGLRAEATKQSQMIERLVMQIKASKMEIEKRVREKMFGDRMKSSISVCNPMMGMQTGMSTGAFDGISSQPGLQLAGNISLGNDAFCAMRQLLVSPAVSSYIGIDPAQLSQLLYNKTDNNDMMCLLSKSSAASGLYRQLPTDEQALINAKFNNTHNRLYGMYEGTLERLEQALASAFSLIQKSSVKCRKQNQQTIPVCQIQPQFIG